MDLNKKRGTKSYFGNGWATRPGGQTGRNSPISIQENVRSPMRPRLVWTKPQFAYRLECVEASWESEGTDGT